MGDVKRLLVACGLMREAKLIRRCLPDAVVVAGGGDGARLERELDAACPPAAMILSIGIAGALDPALKPGDVVTEGVIGSDSIVATVAQKAALRAATGAAAVDMETHIAQRVAQRHGLPFHVLRAISDSADEALPPAALVGMRPDGGLALGAVLLSLARQPGQLPALLRLGRNTSLALGGLEAALSAFPAPDRAG